MIDSPQVTIAILNYNGRQYLERNLPFLYKLSYDNYKITVIDNSSTDGSVEWLKINHSSIKVIRNNGNFGFAKGYNNGLKKIESKYYLLLNTDVEVTTSLLEPMVTLLEVDDRAAACQPKILSLENRSLFEYAGAAGGMIDRLGYPFARGRLFFTCEVDNQQYDDDTEIFWASGACILIKSEYFWKAEGFYEYFFMQQEEVDLCWRLKLAGYKIMYTGQSKVYHLGGGNLSYTNSTKTLLNFRNNWVMLYRNLPSSYFWFYLMPLRLALDILASFYFLFKTNYQNFKAVYSALYQFNKWRIEYKKVKRTRISVHTNLTGIHNTSIVLKYFLKRKKKFTDL